MFNKNGKVCAIEMNDSKNGFSINSTFNIDDSETSPPEIEIKSLSTDQDVFYIQFSHDLLKNHKIQMNREDVMIPEQFTVENISRYCPVKRYKSNLSPFVQAIYTVDVNQCKFCLGHSNFRPELKFKVLIGLLEILIPILKACRLLIPSDTSIVISQLSNMNCIF